MLYVQFPFRKQFTDSFVKNEAEGADVGAHAGGIAYVEKFYILVVIYTEIQPFGTVVDLCTDHLVGEIKIKTVINIQK